MTKNGSCVMAERPLIEDGATRSIGRSIAFGSSVEGGVRRALTRTDALNESVDPPPGWEMCPDREGWMRKVTHRPASELTGPHFSTMRACESHPPHRAWGMHKEEHRHLAVEPDAARLRAALSELVDAFEVLQVDWNDGTQAGSRCVDALEEAERALGRGRG